MKKTILFFVLILSVILKLSAQDTLNLFPPINFQVVMPPNTDYAHLTWNAPVDSTMGEIPQGVVGYNIYRDGEVLTSIDHPVTEYFDLNLFNPTNTYQVSAVYDLTFYGFPGETGESTYAGPLTIYLNTAHLLPFSENFTTGLFETNQWTPDGTYWGDNSWKIAGQAGMPAPGAYFTYHIPRTAYSRTLTSWWFDGRGYIDGQILMDFDLKKEIMNSTQTEFLFVDVFNGTEWIQVKEFTNDANSDWQTYTINITDGAFGHLSRIRFRAEGESTANIKYWTIDNIKIYRNCEPAKELYAGFIYPGLPCIVLCEWEYTEPSPDETTRNLLHFNVYREDTSFNYIGSTSNQFYYDTLTHYSYEYCYYVTAVYDDCESDFDNFYCFWSWIDCSIGVDKLELNQAQLYPNPASSLVTVEVNQPVSEFRVYNLQGNQIGSGLIPDRSTILDVSRYLPGIYLIKFIGRDGSVFGKKMVVQ